MTPAGVVPLDQDGVEVTVTLRPVTATRNFEVGLRLVGTDPDLDYAFGEDRVVITVGGSVADLDRLTGSTIVADLDVSGLGPGTSEVPVAADLPAGVTLVSATPDTVAVTITAGTASGPSPAPSPSAALGGGG